MFDIVFFLDYSGLEKLCLQHSVGPLSDLGSNFLPHTGFIPPSNPDHSTTVQQHPDVLRLILRWEGKVQRSVTMPDNKATKRLKQVSSHLAPKLPADYSDVRDQINTLRDIAATPDPSRRGYVRQKQAGKLWVRERLEQLLDRDTFTEIGSVSGTVKWEKTGPMREKPVSFVPSNNVQGMGRLRGRKVLLTADDFSLRSGHADGSTAGKTIYVEKLALALKLPVIKLVDGSSGGGSVTMIAKAGWSYLPYVPMYKQVVEQLNQGIPNLGAVVGPAVGLPLPL